MTDVTSDPDRLTRGAASAAVSDLGWRYVLGELRTSVSVGSVAQAADVASRAAVACGADADGHFMADVRSDRTILVIQSLADGSITVRDTELAALISTELATLGLRTEAAVGGTAPRALQLVEVAIDAIDIPAIRPFWKAIMGYVDEPGRSGPEIAIVDPYRQGPAIWFQQMSEPRPQRNRFHLDISVPHDEAQRRMAAAIEAGGTMLYDAEAPAFWVFADVEGNEACVTTWQGRD
jgi:4a-hydroxytetrahydrobiopterin dehydratase